MMFLCSVPPELSNYDSYHSVHFCVLIQFVILLGDVIRDSSWVENQKWRGVRFERSLWEPEVLKVHELFTEPLSMEGKYAVKLSITDLIKFSRKWKKCYNGRLWKMQMWSDSYSTRLLPGGEWSLSPLSESSQSFNIIWVHPNCHHLNPCLRRGNWKHMSSNVNYTIKLSFCLLLPQCTVKGSKLFPKDPRHIRSLRTLTVTQDIILVVNVLIENNILMGSSWHHVCWF